MDRSCWSQWRDPRQFSGSRSAFPLQSEDRRPAGGLVASTIPCSPQGVNAPVREPVENLGDKSPSRRGGTGLPAGPGQCPRPAAAEGGAAGGLGANGAGGARRRRKGRLARMRTGEHGILVATMPRSTPRPERPAAASAKPLVRVVRSPRRRKTVTAYRDGDTVVVLLPSRMTKREEAHWVTTMLERLDQRERRRRPPGDEELERRARVLAARYLDGAVEPRSVRWVSNMRSRYGSCTPDDGSIRLSDRIASYPAW